MSASMTTATVVKDRWVTEAMTDSKIVAMQLLRLKQAIVATEPENKKTVVLLRWGVRQRRSRSSRCGGAVGSLRKEADSARGSPMTPLSWSGGSGSGGGGSASPSTTGDGFEETSRHQATCSTSAGSRSKVFGANEFTSGSIKRSKKKKTYSELKDEESVLLKERLHLKKEIATMRATFEEQTTRNENLKRIKLDLNMECAKHTIPNDSDNKNSDQTLERLPSSLDRSSLALARHASANDRPKPDSCKTDRAAPSHGNLFLLPDLNMAPSEVDSGIETLNGTS